MNRRPADEEIVVLDSIGTPALSFAVPAALRLLKSQINNLQTSKRKLRVVTGEQCAERSNLPPQQ
jgi:hypothetical protein